MSIACIFPGTGTQRVGMGRDLYQREPLVRRLYAEAGDTLGFDLAKLSFLGPEDDFKRIVYSQPALLVLSVAGYRLLERSGFVPRLLAGHSLGEFAALVAAGVLSLPQAVRLVSRRAQLIERLASGAGSMAAVFGAGISEVRELCRQVKGRGHIQVANLNGPSQVVVSGTKPSIEALQELAKRRPGCKVGSLRVDYPFHSELLKPVERPLKLELERVDFRDAKVPIVSNRGEVEARGSVWRRLLLRQLCGPVHWQKTVEVMIAGGIQRFVEVGPGHVLRGLMRRIEVGVDVLGVDSCHSLKYTLDRLNQKCVSRGRLISTKEAHECVT